MITARRMRFRRWLMVGTVCGVAVAGCRADRAEWAAALAAQDADRLVGLWTVELRLDRSVGDTLPARTLPGEIALTLNERRLSATGFGSPPVYFGTYDIAFDALGLRAGVQGGVPAVVGMLRGTDTLELKLAPESQQRVELSGMVRGDSVVGRWRAFQPRGIDAVGDFLLRRR